MKIFIITLLLMEAINNQWLDNIWFSRIQIFKSIIMELKVARILLFLAREKRNLLTQLNLKRVS